MFGCVKSWMLGQAREGASLTPGTPHSDGHVYALESASYPLDTEISMGGFLALLIKKSTQSSLVDHLPCLSISCFLPFCLSVW